MHLLEVLRAVDFDWTLHVQSVWADNPFSASRLHQTLRNDILDGFEQLLDRPGNFSPLGRVVLGPAGAGKTHLLGDLRREVYRRGGGFVLVDMTDVNDFMETTALGYLSSLFQPGPKKMTQSLDLYRHLLKMIRVGARGVPLTLDRLLENIHRFTPDQLTRLRRMVLTRLRERYPDAIHHQDVIRAFLLLNSPDFHEQDLGYLWLQSHPIDAADQKNHGFNRQMATPTQIIRGLSWLMHLKSPVMLALDQFDAVVSEVAGQCGDNRHAPSEQEQEQRNALAVIEKIASGLMALRDMTTCTLSVAACLESTWSCLRQRALKSSTDRFKPPAMLGRISSAQIAATIVGARLSDACRRMQYTPPYPTWPIKPEAFETATELFPREILKRCDGFRQRCLDAGAIVEPVSFDPVLHPAPGQEAAPGLAPTVLDETFKALYSQAPLTDILDPDHGDEKLCLLIQTACRCVIKESDISDAVDVTLETRFSGGAAYPTLHARICIIHQNSTAQERHFSIRGLQKQNTRAFQARLKAAMTAAGISGGLAFRHLLIFRNQDVPTGVKTDELMAEFVSAGGRLGHLTESDIRTLWALAEMEKSRPDHFESWLLRKQPVTHTGHFQLFFKWLTME